MKKQELAYALVISIILGLGLSLGMGNRNSANRRALDYSITPDITFSTPDKSIKTPSASDIPLGVSQPTQTQIPLQPAEKAGVDIEDVLLVYSQGSPSYFSINFCILANYYGLACKKVSADSQNMSDDLLRDSQGEYFKFIGLDAEVIRQGSTLISEDELNLLIKIVKEGYSDLFVSKISDRIDESRLARLTNGSITGVSNPDDLLRDWIVSSTDPEITREFSGQVIVTSQSASPFNYRLIVDNTNQVSNLITSSDQAGDIYPIFVRWKSEDTTNGNAGSIFLDAGESGERADEIPLQELVYSAARFTQIVPMMMAIRYSMGDEVWHNDHNFANLTIDRGVLAESTQGLDYTVLLQFMKTHNFHTTVALIPANWNLSSPNIVAMFLVNPDRYSLAQYGNNADGYEFYFYNEDQIDQRLSSTLPPRPMEEQEWNIMESLARMEMHNDLTRIPYEKVMIFPLGLSPVHTLEFLKKNNYLATISTQDIPLGETRPDNLNFGMYPANLDFGNFPILTRRFPGDNQAFQPALLTSFMDLFLDKPALFYTYPYGDGLYPGDMDVFNPIADQLNDIPGGVEWQGLGYILQHLYLEKTNDNGSIDVSMYTNKVFIENLHFDTRTFHVTKSEDLNVPILRVTVNGHEFPYEIENDELSLDVSIPPGISAEIAIEYKNAIP